MYFESAQAEYKSQLGVTGARLNENAEQAAQEIVDRYKADANSLTMTDALLYERLVSRYLSSPALKRKLMTVRARYRRMVGAEDYQVYLDSGTTDPLSSTEDELRADLDNLLGRMHWVYVVTPFRETMRSRMSIRAVLALLATLLAVGVMVRLRDDQFTRRSSVHQASAAAPAAQVLIPPLFVAVLLGAIGGLVSVQQRIQSAPAENDDAIRSVMSLYNGMFSLYLSPVMGAISAGLLYALFIGGFLQGSLFPKLYAGAEGTSVLDFEPFLVSTGPQVGVEYAKLVIWSFIAGFAERFVPDTLSRLVGTVESSGGGGVPPRPVLEPPSFSQASKPGETNGRRDDSRLLTADEVNKKS